MQFDCGTRILGVIHGRDARATFANCVSTQNSPLLILNAQGGSLGKLVLVF